jgi:hypothetical protein
MERLLKMMEAIRRLVDGCLNYIIHVVIKITPCKPDPSACIILQFTYLIITLTNKSSLT